MTAAIICLATYVAVSASNIPMPTEDYRFKGIVDDFIIEAPKVINYAIANKHEVLSEIQNFDADFQEYMRSINADIGIIYMVKIDGMINIKNIHNQTVEVRQVSNSYDAPYMTMISIPISRTIQIFVDNEAYTYTFNEAEETEFKALFIKKE